MDTRDRAAVEPAYETALLRELELITDAIPADDLSIRWDTAVEFGMIPDLCGWFLDLLTRVGDAVPSDVELGYHLCHGDSGHEHFVEPKDTSHPVAVANALAARLSRPLGWLHLPVPPGRTDVEYFEPLRTLALPPATELYLGLIHSTDGAAGATGRITAALSAVDSSGVATECGFGHRAPATVPALLALHAVVADL
ncbi:hypothetical protein [Amycolatopsis sp. FDAARGOS 1241]|uniref:hypothetical protein n=1 Tax=Amycolatopsis sp. FDAARGOS 1241 TaxID=2778070 RepID=UPI0019529496|nr:hypothetical protein [Amycolatopsis sp. FDAARGOS 1241]QRP48218.1 hypothetical protein I6J71_10250 [Amycolatopsis sp. FDAARGOS 1241]